MTGEERARLRWEQRRLRRIRRVRRGVSVPSWADVRVAARRRWTWVTVAGCAGLGALLGVCIALAQGEPLRDEWPVNCLGFAAMGFVAAVADVADVRRERG